MPAPGASLMDTYSALDQGNRERVNTVHAEFAAQKLPFDASKLEVRGVDIVYNGVNIGYPPMDPSRGDPEPPILESVPTLV